MTTRDDININELKKGGDSESTNPISESKQDIQEGGTKIMFLGKSLAEHAVLNEEFLKRNEQELSSRNVTLSRGSSVGTSGFKTPPSGSKKKGPTPQISKIPIPTVPQVPVAQPAGGTDQVLNRILQSVNDMRSDQTLLRNEVREVKSNVNIFGLRMENVERQQKELDNVVEGIEDYVTNLHVNESDQSAENQERENKNFSGTPEAFVPTVVPSIPVIPGDTSNDFKPASRSPNKTSDQLARELLSRNKKKESDKDNSEYAYLDGNRSDNTTKNFVPSNNGIDADQVFGDDNPFIHTKINYSNNRRASFERSIPADPIFSSPTANGNPSTTLVVTPYVIEEDKKMKHITLSGLKRLLEQYELFKASTYDNTKTLIFFINYECQVALVKKQMSLHTPLIQKKLNFQNVYLLKDEHTQDMISDYIRPESRIDFVQKFYQAMTKPTWPKDFEFTVENYEDKVFPYIATYLTEVQIYDHYLRRNAAPYQLDYMPAMEWGKNTSGGSGMIRIAMEILNNKHFVTLLKEEVLKSIKSMKDFIAYFDAKNVELCKLSRELKHNNTLLKEPEDYKTIAAVARKKSQDYQAYKEKAKSPSKSPPARRKFRAYVKNSLNEIVPMEFNFVPPVEDEDEFVVDLIDNSDDELDENLSEDEWQKKTDVIDQYKDETKKIVQEWHDSEIELALHALCAMEPTYAPRLNKDGIKIYKAKPVNTKEQACFQYAFGHCEAGKDCIYSHESEKIKKFLRTSYEKLALSPAWDPRFITEANTKRNSGGSGYDRRNVTNKSNHGGRGGSASQSPASNQRSGYSNNTQAKNYIIVEKNTSDENPEELSGTGNDQLLGAEKQLALLRGAQPSASRDNADC